jgi:hypothetical protein
VGIRIGTITIDTNDVGRAAAFWQSATSYEVASSGDDHTLLVDPAKQGPGLFVQLVPEPAVGKNRLHLDLHTDDLAGEVARFRTLGATELRAFSDGESQWTVLSDTDGNQFCVVAG